jgi:hypothetical protein
MVQNYINTPNFEVHSLLNFVGFKVFMAETMRSTLICDDKFTDTSEEYTASISKTEDKAKQAAC